MAGPRRGISGAGKGEGLKQRAQREEHRVRRGIAVLKEGGGDEGEDENEEREESGGEEAGVQPFGLVDGKRAEKTDGDEHCGPDVPAGLEAEGQKNQEQWKKDRADAMGALADGAEDVATVELRGGKQVERSGEQAYPGGAADGMKEEVCGVSAMVKNRREKMQDERSAEDDLVIRWRGEAGDKLGVDDAVDQRGNGDEEADKRSGRADVEQCACGANGRTDEDEGAKRADQRWEGNKERIAGVNVVVAASEKMGEFVSEENRKQCKRERESGGQGERVTIGESERVNKFVPGDGFVVGAGGDGMLTGDED